MKLIENKYQHADGETRTCEPNSGVDRSFRNNTCWHFIGQVTTEIDVPKKEVEKVVKAEMANYGSYQRINNDRLPHDAYDVRIYFKVKE
jgi:hypothetical protein